MSAWIPSKTSVQALQPLVMAAGCEARCSSWCPCVPSSGICPCCRGRSRAADISPGMDVQQRIANADCCKCPSIRLDFDFHSFAAHHAANGWRSPCSLPLARCPLKVVGLCCSEPALAQRSVDAAWQQVRAICPLPPLRVLCCCLASFPPWACTAFLCWARGTAIILFLRSCAARLGFASWF